MEREDCLYTGRVELSRGTLNVRDAPEGRVTGQLSSGETVAVLEDNGEWVRIAYDTGEGYAAKRYIYFVQADAAARLVIEDEAGHAFAPEGGISVRIASGPID